MPTQCNPGTTPLQAYRTTISKGDWTYVWTIDGGLTNTWTLNGSGSPLPVMSLSLRSLEPYDSLYHQAVGIPESVGLGSYMLVNSTSGKSASIMVIDKQPSSSVGWVSPMNLTDAAPIIQSALGSYDIVNLAGGVYPLGQAISVPARKTLRGYGATLIRANTTGQDRTPIFSLNPQGQFVVEGVTFAADRRKIGDNVDASVVFAQETSGTEYRNITLRRCVFRNVSLGDWNKPGFLADDCIWEEGGRCDRVTGPCMFLRCKYHGLADPSYHDAWSALGGWSASGIALLDCDFIGTNRGPVFGASLGNVQYSLVSGLVCDRMAQANNLSSGIRMEADPTYQFYVKYNLFLHCRYRGEGAAVSMQNVEVQYNKFRDFVFDGGNGIYANTTSDFGPRDQTCNDFIEGEVRGGRCQLFSSAHDNSMTTVGFIGPRPTRGERFSGFIPDITNQKAITNFANNMGIAYPSNVKVARLLDGWAATD